MLWTVMNEEKIWEGMDKIQIASEYSYQHRRILGYPTADGRVQIVQLITSNPSDYLDPRFAPGSIIFAKKL